MKKHLISLAASALMAVGTAATAAPAFQDFVIQEGSVPGSAANEFVADKLNGGYTELLTLNADNTFDTAAYVNFGAFFRNEGSTLVTPTQLNGFGVGGYGLYAIFYSSGTYGAGTFTGTSGSFDLYIDPNSDTQFTGSFGATGADTVTPGNTGDDYRIAFANTLSYAVGILGTPGAYDLLFNDFQLTSEGEGYFIAPRPFHMIVQVNGDFDNFTPTPGNFTVTGDVSAVFVPEPASLALVGLALVGLSLSTRRRKV